MSFLERAPRVDRGRAANAVAGDAIYWCELAEALRPLVGVAVLLGAACAAALTLTGAAAPPRASGGACGTCGFHPIAQRHIP